MTRLMLEMEQIYGSTTVLKDNKTYHIEPELSNIMDQSRDWEELKWAWQAWRNATGPRMKDSYAKLVDVMNEAAREHGELEILFTFKPLCLFSDLSFSNYHNIDHVAWSP